MAHSGLPSARGGARAAPFAGAVLVVVIVLVVLAPPAAAHVRAGAASDLDSRVTSAPTVDGVSWRLYAGGDLIEVTNSSGADVVVLGYEGEPYLRVGPDGVFENRNSPATYLNTERYGDVALPPGADASAPPEWVRVADEPTRAWHDHRVHWMSPDLPPAVAADPGTEQHVLDWVLPFLHDGVPHELAGELWWVPGGPVWPWLAVAMVLTAPAVAGAVRRRGDVTAVVRPAAVTVGLVAAVNGIHFVDEVLSWPSPTLDVLFGVFHTALFVGTGLVGAAIAWHGTQGPRLSLLIASGAVLLHQGLLQVSLLGASQLPTVWPPPLLRLAVALSLAQAVWVAVALALGTGQAGGDTDRDARRLRADEPTPPESFGPVGGGQPARSGAGAAT